MSFLGFRLSYSTVKWNVFFTGCSKEFSKSVHLESISHHFSPLMLLVQGCYSNLKFEAPKKASWKK